MSTSAPTTADQGEQLLLVDQVAERLHLSRASSTARSPPASSPPSASAPATPRRAYPPAASSNGYTPTAAEPLPPLLGAARVGRTRRPTHARLPAAHVPRAPRPPHRPGARGTTRLIA